MAFVSVGWQLQVTVPGTAEDTVKLPWGASDRAFTCLSLLANGRVHPLVNLFTPQIHVCFWLYMECLILLSCEPWNNCLLLALSFPYIHSRSVWFIVLSTDILNDANWNTTKICCSHTQVFWCVQLGFCWWRDIRLGHCNTLARSVVQTCFTCASQVNSVAIFVALPSDHLLICRLCCSHGNNAS